MTPSQAQDPGQAPESWYGFAEPPLADPAHVWCQRSAESQTEETFPVAVKANIAVRGLDHSAASPALAGHAAQVDASTVATLRRHGARVVGTNNMHELAFGITSGNAAFGAVENPAVPGHSAGGSSGGSAAAVAAGLVPLALGTDTGGSITIPASVCGVAGLRPSTGRWGGDGVVGLSWTRDTVGAFARSVADVALVDEWLSGTDVREHPSTGAAPDPTRPADVFRFGVPVEWTQDLEPATAQAFSAATQGLGAAPSIELIPVSIAPALEELGGLDMAIVAYESKALLTVEVQRRLGLSAEEAWQRLRETVTSPDVVELLRSIGGAPVPPELYATAVGAVERARLRTHHIMDEAGVDALLFPSTPRTATPLGENEVTAHQGVHVPVFGLMTRHAALGSSIGAPMVTQAIPVGKAQAPVGITVQGRRGADRVALRAAAVVEATLSGVGREA